MTELVKTILPLSPLDMVEFFKDKEKIFLIDYVESKKEMSAKSILIYLSNLQINCEFDSIDAELVTEYLYLKDLCNTPELDVFVANLVYFDKYNEPYLDTQSFADFGVEVLKENAEVINFYKRIMESSTLYILSKNFEELKENESEEQYPTRSGFCFLNLYKIPDFLIMFLADIKPLEDQIYFDEYFDNDNYIFKGKNLFEYFAHDDNLFYKYLVNLSRVQDFIKGDESEESLDGLNKMVDIYTALND